jgi:hypothetical protein
MSYLGENCNFLYIATCACATVTWLCFFQMWGGGIRATDISRKVQQKEERNNEDEERKKWTINIFKLSKNSKKQRRWKEKLNYMNIPKLEKISRKLRRKKEKLNSELFFSEFQWEIAANILQYMYAFTVLPNSHKWTNLIYVLLISFS